MSYRFASSPSDMEPATISARPAPEDRETRTHIVTVSLEDYFQGPAFRKILTPLHWSRLEHRVQQNTDRTLLLLSRLRARATFFVSTWLAEQLPSVIQKVIAEGHEIGSSGVTQQSFRNLSSARLREEARTSKYLLEQLTGYRVRGFRVADHRLTSSDLWALRVLAEEGYDFDSSLSPSLGAFRDEPHRQFLHSEEFGVTSFYELPIPAFNFFGLKIPIGGGNYFRQIPESFLKRAVASWIKSTDAPFVFYFRIWDLDPNQPEITGAPFLAKVRHYRNAQKMPILLESLLSGRSLVGISEYLGLPVQTIEVAARKESPVQSSALASAPAVDRIPITVIVPCFNEAHSLPYLSKALEQLEARLAHRHEFFFVFVDDGSRDQTWSVLQQIFGASPKNILLRHQSNTGITAAILTAARAAHTEIVCSIDCDCTYDPLDLANMLPLASDDVDCVTASPYSPEGRVINVPGWRLFLSGGASFLYRAVLGANLYTYTSCFRVYKRARLLTLTISEPGFVGIAEILGRLHLGGGRITEYPTTLAVRMLGHSKMKLLRNILLHIRLLSKLGLLRLTLAHNRDRGHTALRDV